MLSVSTQIPDMLQALIVFEGQRQDDTSNSTATYRAGQTVIEGGRSESKIAEHAHMLHEHAQATSRHQATLYTYMHACLSLT